MQAVFPGRPQPKLQAVDTVIWQDLRILVYVSGNALIILRGPNELLQTATHGEDEQLEAVAIDRATGKIATCTNDTVFVYQPIGQDMGDIRWVLLDQTTPLCEDKELRSLSWGLPDEVLASGSQLTLFQTSNTLNEQWTKKLANPAKLALFSHDASLIASNGWCDRLVKVWRRLFIGGGDERFDAAYLPHPSAVTSLRWRGRHEQGQHWDAVLYTLCTDNVLRIWSSSDPHCLTIMALWTEVDLVQCIQPRTPLSPSPFKKRWTMVLDSWDFSELIEARRDQPLDERQNHALEHLDEVASRKPEVLIVLDENGNVSTWGLENIGQHERKEREVFNFSHAENLNLQLPQGDVTTLDYAQLTAFTHNKCLNVAVHKFNGILDWLSSPIDDIFDPSSRQRSLKLESSLTGHADVIRKLDASHEGNLLVSLSDDHEIVLWKKSESGSLTRASILPSSQKVVTAKAMQNFTGLVTISPNAINLWDYRSTDIRNHEVAKIEESQSTSCEVFSLDERTYILVCGDRPALYHVSISASSITADELKIEQNDVLGRMISSPSSEDDGRYSPQWAVSPTDGKFAIRNRKDSVDVFWWSIDDKSGDARLRPISELPIITSGEVIHTISGVKYATTTGSTNNDFAIWDASLACLEYKESLPSHEDIVQLKLIHVGDSAYALAVLSQRQVRVYLSRRYDFCSFETPWLIAKSINVSQFTNLPMNDCAWLSSSNLTVCAGNQMFSFDTSFETYKKPAVASKLETENALHMVADSIHSSRPGYHPDFISSCMLSDKLDAASKCLLQLHENLKFSTEGEPLDYLLEVTIPRSEPEQYSPLTQDTAADLVDRLGAVSLPYLLSHEQDRLQQLVTAVGSMENRLDSVDKGALHYMLQLELSLDCSWREISWAFLSSSQEIIADAVSQKFRGKINWADARKTGMFMWLSDIEAVRTQFENIARNEYSKTEERDPIDCSLYYLALKKKSVLSGLWRMATWNKEQRATIKLLANNFDDPRWRTAALKNAYALLGKRRIEYAAAFFLLAGNLRDAVGVLANQLDDLQLAIAVARVYEGDNGPVLKELIETRVLPRATKLNDKAQAAWAFMMLQQPDRALLALTSSESSPGNSQSWDTCDPSTVALYRHLRENMLSSMATRNKARAAIEAEYDFVLRSAILYQRMGCPALALDLIRSWSFPRDMGELLTKPQTNGNSVVQNEAGPDQVETDKADAFGIKQVETQAAPIVNGATPALEGRKKVIEEPSASSILDNFDF